MAYTPHVLVAFGGSWSDQPAEVWECTVRILANGGGGVTIDPDAYLGEISGQLSTWFANQANGMSSLARLAWVKANHIGADGRYVDATTTHLHDYSPAVVGGAQALCPGFTSLAYTWETASLRGPGHRGRVYPPNCTHAFTSKTMTVDDAARDANATAGAGLLALLKNSAGANGTKGTPVVASKVNGAVTPIIGCTSDNIMDVQRRRKNRAAGTRSAIVAFA